MAKHHSPAQPPPTMDTDTAVDGGAEPICLFEDSWFFGNLFNHSPRPARTMSRCFSDPCTSSRTFMEVPSSGVAEASPEGGLTGDSVREMEEAGGKRGIKGKLTRQRSCKQRMIRGHCGGSRRNLVRTPSLPATVVFGGGDGEDDDDDDDDESDVRMSNLIRNAFAQSKGTVQSLRTPRSNYRPPAPRNTDSESNNLTPSSKESSINPPRRSPNPNLNPNPLMKSVSNLETLFQQSSLIGGPRSDSDGVGLSRGAMGSNLAPSSKESSSINTRRAINPNPNPNSNPNPNPKPKPKLNPNPNPLMKSVSNLETLFLQSSLVSRPGSHLDGSRGPLGSKAQPSCLQDKKRADHHQQQQGLIRRTQSTKVSSDDLKAQIKLWARNVATNVRQEC